MHLPRNAYVAAVEIELAGNSLVLVSPNKLLRGDAFGASAPMSASSCEKGLANV